MEPVPPSSVFHRHFLILVHVMAIYGLKCGLCGTSMGGYHASERSIETSFYCYLCLLAYSRVCYLLGRSDLCQFFTSEFQNDDNAGDAEEYSKDLQFRAGIEGISGQQGVGLQNLYSFVCEVVKEGE